MSETREERLRRQLRENLKRRKARARAVRAAQGPDETASKAADDGEAKPSEEPC